MKKPLLRYVGPLLVILSVVEGLLSPSIAQTTVHRDPAIAQLVEQVSADSLKAHVEKLVSFGTRQTLSGTQGKRGIVPAREWILSKFQEFGKQSGGRLTATIDTGRCNPTAAAWTRLWTWAT